MAGVILETLSNRKLIAFAVIMFVLQVGFFLIGGLIGESFSALDSMSVGFL